MAIEGEGDANSPLNHQNETQGLDRREFVKARTFEIGKACSMSREVQGNSRNLGTTLRESFQASATFRCVLRSRNVNVSTTTDTDVWSRAPELASSAQVSLARGCSGSRVSANAIQAPVSTKHLFARAHHGLS
jgi:hypothetical protein